LSLGLFAQEVWTKNFPKLTEYPARLPAKNKVWVFVMAGQSNMAGRAFVDAQDTLAHPRIFTINVNNHLILAKEPIHFYEPLVAGLDCGLSFAKRLVQTLPDSVSILIIPAAVGGSSIRQWRYDSVHRKVQLFSNLVEKISIGKRYGIVKAILWHQGESDANEKDVVNYQKSLTHLFKMIRDEAADVTLPIITGGIGLFKKDTTYQHIINKEMENIRLADKNIHIIQTDDFTDKGDKLHFDSGSQRLMGERMADAFFQSIKQQR